MSVRSSTSDHEVLPILFFEPKTAETAETNYVVLEAKNDIFSGGGREREKVCRRCSEVFSFR